MIDEVIVLTLERSETRQMIWKAAARLYGIPFEKVRFFKGDDSKKFRSRQDVIDAAIADGFEDIDKFCADEYMDHSQLTKAGIAQAWSYLSILQYVVNTGKTVLFMFDDISLTVPFHLLNDIIKHLESLSNPFYILQLRLIVDSKDEIPELSQAVQNAKDAAAFEIATSPFQNAEVFYSAFLREGICGANESSIVISPTGANWFLDAVHRSEKRHFYVERFFQWELAQLCTSNIGVYCPNRTAYNFANEILHLGTDTQWVIPPDIHQQLYDSVNSKEPIKWIL